MQKGRVTSDRRAFRFWKPEKLVVLHLHHGLRPDRFNPSSSYWCLGDIYLRGGFKHFLCSSLPGEMIQFDEHIFQMG